MRHFQMKVSLIEVRRRDFTQLPATAIILPNDFTCRETRLHNADWFNRMITLGSIQRYAV